jgi:ribosomal-protein-alanine N-acetyltransferase
MDATETNSGAKMSNLIDTLGGLADRSFLTVLPISDGVVKIRAMSDADAEAYVAGTNDALVKRFAHLPLEEYTPQIVRNMIQGAIAEGLRDGTLAVLAISSASSDSFLGSLVFFDIKPDDAEIGYWVAPEHRGRKVSGQALTLAIEIARKLGLKRLRARTVQENTASEKVLLNAGFEQVGEARPEIVPSGKTEMGVNYLIEV